MTRAETLQKLRQQPDLSVLIVGGGINGIGLFWDLALQGLDVLLVERADFGGGTSAASTRIIHGGLRYLENAEFRLVRESVNERNRLLQNAPHYVRPLPITIPIDDWASGMIHTVRKFLGFDSKAGSRGALVFKAGLTMYDIYAGPNSPMPRHSFAMRDAALAKRKELRTNIVATATYYDARISYPERLCLELIMDAEAASDKVHALNYLGVVGAEGDTVKLRDELTGDEVQIKPTVVVNATGAWIDFTNQAMTRPSQMIGGTKGSHLVVDHAGLYEATKGEMLYFANDDGRICIFYPFYDKVIVGSTDIPVGDPDSAVCDTDETDYLLKSVTQVFPDIKLERSDVVFQFCGVRPLPRSDASTTGQISRDHSSPLIPPGDGIDFPIYSLVGGKWTTFRAFAEQMSAKLLPLFDKQRTVRTEDLSIGGGKDYPRTESAVKHWLEDLHAKTDIEIDRLALLLDHYGTRGRDIALFMAEKPDRVLTHHDGYTEREIIFLIQNERVEHLEDIILRRTLIGMLGETTLPLLQELADIMMDEMGWSAERRDAEIQRARDVLLRRHQVELNQTEAAGS